VTAPDALRFIHSARSDPRLAEQIRALGAEVRVADLVRLGAEAGFHFTEEELRAAHGRDWVMRWLRYDAPPAPERAEP
jgi:predicted ribosomally synthesized peptide with nif11-like leader